MPRLISFRLVAACALVVVFALSTAASAIAKGPLANLRVVSSSGKVLAEDSLGAGTASIKTSPKADCFGTGTGGSGKAVTIQGPTALGLLIRASKFTSALKPVLISDYFDFGLALCGVGGQEATTKLSWYLKVNHKNPNLGGEMVKVHAGDDVLWMLASFPYPDELALIAPDKAKKGKPFGVRVFSYDDRGKKTPAEGVKVTGAKGRTGSDGRTTVVLHRSGVNMLRASHGQDIPSNTEAVCVPLCTLPEA
ncbi:MAG TPA: hypothetical protein VF176_01305 [Solirubrobacterales bacterium]